MIVKLAWTTEILIWSTVTGDDDESASHCKEIDVGVVLAWFPWMNNSVFVSVSPLFTTPVPLEVV